MQIGLGLPSHVAFRQNLPRREMSSQESIDARRSSQECYNPSIVATKPPFSTSPSSPQSVESLNQFLESSHFSPRSLYDIIEVPTPSSTSSPSRGTPSPQNQWSSPFTRINPPQKKKKIRFQLSTPDPPVTVPSDVEVEVTNVDPLPVVPVTSAQPGFKRLVSKLTRGLFKCSRSLKTTSPVLIEHANVPPGFSPSSILLRIYNCYSSLSSSLQFQTDIFYNCFLFSYSYTQLGHFMSYIACNGLFFLSCCYR